MNEPMYRKILSTYVGRLIMISVFLPGQLMMYVLLALGVYCLVTNILDRYRSPLSNFGWALFLGFSYVLYFIYLPFTPPFLKSELLSLCENKTAFLALPLAFAAINPQLLTVIRQQLMFFVYACLVCCIVANAFFIYQFCIVPHVIAPFNHVAYRDYMEDISGIHPTYLSLFISFSICILLVHPTNRALPTWVKYVLLYLFLIFLCCLFAKSTFLALLLVLLHYSYINRGVIAKYIWQLSAGMLALGLVLYFIPFFGQRAAEVLQFTGIGKHGGDVTDNSMYVRKLVWDTDLHLLQQYWITGVGPGMLRHMLTIKYFFYSISHQFFVGYYDPHNQYLSDWLSFGLLGIVLLVALIAVHFVTAIKRRDHLYLYLMILLCITFFTETVLARQYGVAFFSLFTPLFFFDKNSSVV